MKPPVDSEEPFLPKRHGWGVRANWRNLDARALTGLAGAALMGFLLVVAGAIMLTQH